MYILNKYIIYTFHPGYIHNDIFRYMTLEVTVVVFFSCTEQVHYPCSYSNRPTCKYSCFYSYLPLV